MAVISTAKETEPAAEAYRPALDHNAQHRADQHGQQHPHHWRQGNRETAKKQT